MEAKNLRIWLVLMIASVIMTGLGCASNRVNLLKDGTVELERIPSKGYYISYVNIYQNRDALVVYGHVKRRSRIGDGSGHVDIAIVSPNGKVLEQISTLYKPRIILTRKMHTRKSTFEVRLPTIPPAGSLVRVVYHRDSKPDREAFSCVGNIALPDVKNL